MRAIRQLWGDPGEQQWQWVVLSKCEWPEIMSFNCSLFLFLFNLKGPRVFLQVQRPHLPKPARGQGADCQAELWRVPHHCFMGFLDGSLTFGPTHKWGRNMNRGIFQKSFSGIIWFPITWVDWLNLGLASVFKGPHQNGGEAMYPSPARVKWLIQILLILWYNISKASCLQGFYVVSLYRKHWCYNVARNLRWSWAAAGYNFNH